MTKKKGNAHVKKKNSEPVEHVPQILKKPETEREKAIRIARGFLTPEEKAERDKNRDSERRNSTEY